MEYQRGIEWLARADPLRRRGLLSVAIGDIDRFSPVLHGRAVDIEKDMAELAVESAKYEHLHPDLVD